MKTIKITTFLNSQEPQEGGGGYPREYLHNISPSFIHKRRHKREVKHRAKERKMRPLLETLIGSIEATKCRQINSFFIPVQNKNKKIEVNKNGK